MLAFLPLIITIFCHCVVECEDGVQSKEPTIFIAIFARNKEVTLPYFLGLLEDQDYPKDRISLWIKTDRNMDRTIEILQTWSSTVSHLYHSFQLFVDQEKSSFPDQMAIPHWSLQRFKHMIRLKEEAFSLARRRFSDFVFFLDCDVFLLNNQTLRYLTRQNKTVIAPMLHSLGLYSNFWCGMNERYYYERTADYKLILSQKKIGCFTVPMVHSATLVNLNHAESSNLTFNSTKLTDYTGPIDDVIIFAISANNSGVSLHVCNEQYFGHIMMPLDPNDFLHLDKTVLVNIKVDILFNHPPLEAKTLFHPYIPVTKPDRMGFDEIYMINLKRRPQRRARMLEIFKVLGMNVSVFDAIDGSTLTDDYIDELGIKFMPNYKDPYHERDMTRGEIGCFLSHYFIWQKVVRDNQQRVMVLEDDVRFEPYFRNKVGALIQELNDLEISWDLVYLGRKRLEVEEFWVEGSSMLVHVAYSYWTLGYLLSNEGAKKLLEAEPLKKLIPVDEYLPILFDHHPRDDWKSYFPNRNLAAYSVHPLLLYPTHYTGEEGYISDTENSSIVDMYLEEPKVEL